MRSTHKFLLDSFKGESRMAIGCAANRGRAFGIIFHFRAYYLCGEKGGTFGSS